MDGLNRPLARCLAVRVCAGVFGMNLPNGWESCPRAFWRVSAALVGGMVGMFATASWYGKQAKVL